MEITAYGEKYQIDWKFLQYFNGGLAVQGFIKSSGEPFCKLSFWDQVITPHLDFDEFCVKTWSENIPIVQALRNKWDEKGFPFELSSKTEFDGPIWKVKKEFHHLIEKGN